MNCKLTRYYTVAEDDYSQDNLIPLLDVNYQTIARVNAEFFAAAALEGSCRLASGQMLNVSGYYVPCDQSTSSILQHIAQTQYHNHYGYAGLSMDGTKYFAWSKDSSNWGLGVHNDALYPFISVAADPTVFPFHTKLFAPQLKGLQLPNGEEHLGYLYVQDRGSAIIGAHLDWFVGFRKWQLNNVPDFIDVEIVSS